MSDLTTVDAALARPSSSGAAATRWWGLLILPAVVVLVGFFAYPLVRLLMASLGGDAVSLDNYDRLWHSDVFRTVLVRTFLTAGIVCFVCLALGYPYAYLMTVVSRRWRNLMLLVVLVPFWTSLMVRTFSWLVLLQDGGLINDGLAGLGFDRLTLIRNTTGVVIGMAQVMLPFAVLPMYSVMQRIDRRLLLAAESCGARPVAAIARIYIPLSMPGVATGMRIVFIVSLGFFITPQLLGSPSNALLSQLMYAEITQLGNWGYGAAMGFVLLASTIVLLVLVQSATRATVRVAGRQGGEA